MPVSNKNQAEFEKRGFAKESAIDTQSVRGLVHDLNEVNRNIAEQAVRIRQQDDMLIAAGEVAEKQAARIKELENKLRFVMANPVYISECATAWSVRFYNLTESLRMKSNEYQEILDVLKGAK